MASTKRPRESYEGDEAGRLQGASGGSDAVFISPEEQEQLLVSKSSGGGAKDSLGRSRRRSSCIRAGEFFLRQLENRVDLQLCETPLQQVGPSLRHSKQQKTAQHQKSSPLTLPSLRKLRFRSSDKRRESSTPLKCIGNTSGDGTGAAKSAGKRCVAFQDSVSKSPIDIIPVDEERSNNEDDDAGFIIHCSQNYERSCDQTLFGTPETADNEGVELGLERWESEEKANNMEEPLGLGTSQQSTDLDLTARHAALHSTPKSSSRPIQCSYNFAQGFSTADFEGNPASLNIMKTPTYAVFRNISDRKTVHIIRHGESVYNAIDRYSRSLEDPFVFDAPLTDVGRQQALALKDKLVHLIQSKHKGVSSNEVLWVTSPLTRCIQTMLTAYHQYTKTLKIEKAEEMPTIKVCHHMAEHLATTGDIGRPRSLLEKDFPKIAEALKDLDETWWWQPEKNDALAMKFDSREPKKNLQKRVGLFRQWLFGQSHKVIIAFGHSTFWKEFSGTGNRLKNCEVDTIHV